MHKSASERLWILEALLQEHKKDFDDHRKEVKSSLKAHDDKDQQRTDMIMKKIEEMEKKFDTMYVQRREVLAVSAVMSFIAIVVWLFLDIDLFGKK